MSSSSEQTISRRELLRTAAIAAVGVPLGAALGQGRCMRRFGTPGCDTTAIAPVFEKTGWKTTALDSLTMVVTDYRGEAAFYNALMGWTLRSDDGKQAMMDMGDRGTIILRGAEPGTFSDSGGRAAGGGRAASHAVVESFAFAIDPWDARKVEAELRRRGLSPVADNSGPFESFHIKDPDGFPLQISNGKHDRRAATSAKLNVPLPFASTGWKTVWLDHLSFSVTNYKQSASFYINLLGWTPTYDEGSQNECMIGDVGDIIIRGGNPLDPQFGRGGGRGGGRGDSTASSAPNARRARIDHISFGISPWDTDKVKEELEKRGLRARVDTSTGDEIHVAAFKSYHTTTPNGYDLQISAVTHDARLTLPNAVRPKPSGNH
jgi:catechol 2,3-dioxygenase-like lactoylglutathione lyase family enzyme